MAYDQIAADWQAEATGLREENVRLRETNRRLLAALSAAVGHLVGHPGTTRLLADLVPDSEKPSAPPNAEGPIPPIRTTPEEIA